MVSWQQSFDECLPASLIEWTAYAERTFVEDMGVDLGSLYIFMPKQFLNGTDIVASLKQMGGRAMAEDVRRDITIEKEQRTQRLILCG